MTKFKSYVKHETLQAKLIDEEDGFSEELIGKHYLILKENGKKELRDKKKFEQEYEEEWKI